MDTSTMLMQAENKQRNSSDYEGDAIIITYMKLNKMVHAYILACKDYRDIVWC